MAQNQKIRCLIIDDEPPARDVLKKHIVAVEALELAGESSNAVEALSFLQFHPVDLLFLDIQMPHILGTNFLRTLKNPPKVIFTTAYQEYTLKRFDLNTVDYLLKPISFERFLQAINKVMQTNITANSSNQNPFNVAEKSHPFLYFRADRKMSKFF